jgi:hypothetical protein
MARPTTARAVAHFVHPVIKDRSAFPRGYAG